MKIQKAKIKDAEKILTLQKLAYQSEAILNNDFNIPPLKQTLDEMRNQFTEYVILKAVEDNKIIGSVRAYEKDSACFIERLFVHPDKQNHGVGAMLMESIENIFKDAKRFELATSSKSKRNIYLYEKFGYKIFDTFKIDEIPMVRLEKK